MNTLNIPGFTAETSVYEKTRQYRSTGMQRSGRRKGITVVEAATTMTCGAHDSGVCTVLCDGLHGGMSSNPDGSVSCNF